MGRLSLSKVGWILLASSLCLLSHPAPANANSKEKSPISSNLKETSKSPGGTASASSASTPSKSTLKRETLPQRGLLKSHTSPSTSTSSESLRTASQTLFGYQGQGQQNAFGGSGAFGQNSGQFGSNPYNSFGGASYPGNRQFGGFGGQNAFGGFGSQYSQLGNVQGAYNVLDQGQFGGQTQGYYPGGNYFGGGAGAGGFNQYTQQYNPYATSTGGAYPFGGFNSGGFGGFGGAGAYPGAFNYPGGGAQFSPQGQGQRNFGFINQGFGNPAFRNPSQISSSSLPSQIQVGTGLEVGGGSSSSSRGFGGGTFPSASGQQYIVGNGIGQPAFIGGALGGQGGPFGGGPFGGGLYSPGGIPGGLYRNQLGGGRFGFGNGLYDYPRTLSSPSPSPAGPGSRPSSSSSSSGGGSRGGGRYYGGGSSSAPSSYNQGNSRERLYRFTTSSE